MINFRINSDHAMLVIRNFRRSRTQLQPALKEFGVLMVQRTHKTFDALAYGGTYRGVTWKPFSPKYRRRPSGARVTPQSKLLQDTGQLRASIVHGLKVDPTGMHLAATKNYAALQQTHRPFLFFENPRDINDLRTIILKKLGNNG